MRKSTRIVKRLLALFLVVLMSIDSFAAVVSDNDGSAFITKAEFDSLKNNFQSQIDQYNTSIDSKIDGAIASYLAGIKVEKVSNIESTLYKLNKNNSMSFQYTTYDPRKIRAGITIQGGISLYKAPFDLNGWRTFVINKSSDKYEEGSTCRIWYYQTKNGKDFLIGSTTDYVRSLLLISGSSMTCTNGDGQLKFGRAVSYNGSGTKATLSRRALSTSVDDQSQQVYEQSAASGWSTQTIYYSLLKSYVGGSLTDYRYIIPAGTVDTTISASDFDERGTRDWEYWTTSAQGYDFSPVASAINATARIEDDIPVFRFKSKSLNVKNTYSYLANSIGIDMPYYGGLPLCTAVYTGTCEFNIKVDKACYLTIKDNVFCSNTTAQADPGVEITKNSETTSANYIELAANTQTKLTFPTTAAHAYYIKLTPKSASDVVKITSLDEKILNKGD